MAYSNITLTTQTGLSFITGEFIQLIHDSNNYMFGQIVSYNPTTGSLTFTPTRVVGSGTYSTWEVIASGAAGNDGTSGTSGINGTSGTSGATGTSGASGTSGTSGTDGTSGSSGIDGTSGTSGLTGTSGTSGVNGTSGVSGTSGTSGVNGASGSSGTAGTSGSSGVNGSSGTSGTSGVNGTSGITPNPNARTETTFTATAGQTTFTVSYTVGQVDVYYNGSKLAPAEFTATTGTDIVLATACQGGDIVDVLANITGGGVGGGGSAGNVAYFSSTNVIAGSNNLAWDNSSKYFTIGAPPTALANLHVYNPSAAASFLLQTNSSTDYSEIAVRNYNSASTSYFRQYSASASGTVLGNSVAGLACFFSNYATNFAIGTRNGGDLILGTADTERARLLASNGYFGIGTSSPSYLLDVNGTGRFTGTVITGSGSGNTLSSGSIDVGKDIGLVATQGIVVNNARVLAFASTGAATFSSSVGTTALNMNNMASLGSIGGGAIFLPYTAGLFFRSADGSTAKGKIQADNSNNLLLNSDNGGNVGIGTSTPNGKLNISNGGAEGIELWTYSATATNLIQSYNRSTSAWNSLEYKAADHIFYGIGSERMRITSGGNVGIGTSSPSKQLVVNQTGTSGYFLSGEASGTEIAYWYYNASEIQFSSKASTRALTFLTSDTERMRITSGGDLRFGNTGQNGQFIYGNSNEGYLSISGGEAAGTTYGANITLVSNSRGGLNLRGELSLSSGNTGGTGSYINFLTNATERMRITSGGNVGIGTSSPVTAGGAYVGLNISGATGSSLVLTSGANQTYLYALNGSSDFAIENAGAQIFRAGSAERMRITSGGTVCIGRTSAPSSAYKAAFQDAVMMAVSTNNNNMINFFNQSDTYVASIVVNASSVAYNTSSDYRLKEDLKEINGLEKVSAIKVYDFKWKTSNERTDGVLAHELAEILPYAVSGEKDGEQMQGVDYSKIVPILVKAIQELKQEIDELKNK